MGGIINKSVMPSLKGETTYASFACGWMPLQKGISGNCSCTKESVILTGRNEATDASFACGWMPLQKGISAHCTCTK
jgi:hypothetical protein